ncbi:MAG: hypothetical protein K6G03_10955, partial [Lachnospiraceae bacterium]|nr:hypothetical protein [Lachnospiraceae bacterium]
MKNKYLRSRISLILSTVILTGNIFSGHVYADTLNNLSIYAGEALAIQGNVISLNDISKNAPEITSTTKISTPEDLIELSKQATIDSYSKNKSFVLTNDIDLTGYDFTSIPSFSGVFDGGGHTIIGLKNNGDGYATGLFRYINRKAIVQDLNVRGTINAVSSEEITGGICAINEGIISNCTFEGTIKGKTITGGIAAINEVPGTIMTCTNKASVTGYYFTGGITGKNYGVTAYCYNNGNINTTTEWVEESDSMDPRKDALTELISEGKDVLNPLNENSKEENSNNTNGIDTGGIAGYSKGALYQCMNKGTVGYEHTGYNVGGVVGRQAGFVSFCKNEGTVYGRKDIGGIVGQMEPHITLEDMETLPDAVDKLHDLVETSIDDMDTSVDVISADVKLLSAFADNAVTSGDAMITTGENYLNSVSYSVNTIKARIDYLSDKMPKFFEYMIDANNHLEDTSDSLDKMLKDADVYNSLSANEVAALKQAQYTIATAGNNAAGIAKKADAVASMNAILLPHNISALSTLSGNRKSLHSNIEKTTSDLEDGLKYSKDVVKHINGMDNASMPYLGSDFDVSRQMLRDNLHGMTNILSVLADHSDSSSDKVSADLSSVNDQMNVVFHIISDELDTIGNFTKGDTDEVITDVSDEEIESIEEGRVDHSSNTGFIKGDINIGGIAGSMAVDSDDQEENAAGSMDGGFTAKYLLRNIILDCNNDSSVESKKDGAGGIVGYMAHGIVADCDSYGSVESTEGGYVGGIAGQSESIVKNSYAMNYLAGDSLIGGITGFGTT